MPVFFRRPFLALLHLDDVVEVPFLNALFLFFCHAAECRGMVLIKLSDLSSAYSSNFPS